METPTQGTTKHVVTNVATQGLGATTRSPQKGNTSRDPIIQQHGLITTILYDNTRIPWMGYNGILYNTAREATNTY